MLAALKRPWWAKRRGPKFPRIDFVLGTPERVADQSPCLRSGGSIAFLVPGMVTGSGGHTSILRLGSWLSRFGYDVTYLTDGKESQGELEARATANLPDWQGRMMAWAPFQKACPTFDVGVATLWTTCHPLLKHQQAFGRKAYFIQDFEPYFYPMGDLYLLAENTYRMGLQHISLGAWNLSRIKAHLGMEGGVSIDFPVELRQFPLVKRPLKHGDTLRLAVYIKEDGKRAPSLLGLMLKVVEERFHARGIRTEIDIFGMDDSRAMFSAGRNLGKLPLDSIKPLYARADFGVVASLTNISLVNYEMLACGLPTIDLQGGSAPCFFDASEMLFAEPRPDGLADLLLAWWGREPELEAMVARSQDKIRARQWTWEHAARQFEGALQRPF